MSEWPFDQAPNVAAITTRQVIEDGFPILNVVHYADDDSWAFVCGTSNATEDGKRSIHHESESRERYRDAG